MDNLAIQAMADIRLHPGLATTLALDVESAKDLLKYWKQTFLRVIHSDSGGDVLNVDVGRVSAGFDLLGTLDDSELLDALRSYGSIFTDASETILALKQQITVEIPQLRTANAKLVEELQKYKENELWQIEQSIRNNDQFTVEMVDKFVQTFLIRATPVDAHDQPVASEVTVFEIPNKYLISEIAPVYQGADTDKSGDEADDLDHCRNPINGMRCFSISVDPTGRASVSDMVIHPTIDDEMVKDDSMDELGFDLSLRELDDLLQKRLESGEHLSSLHNTIATGLIIGFLNAVEVDDAESIKYTDDLQSYFVTRKNLTLREIADRILPMLTNNGLIRTHLDPTDGKPFGCRIRLYEPKNTYNSTYAVILSSTQETNIWGVVFVPIGMVIDKD